MKYVSRTITAKLSLGVVLATALMASVATAQAQQSDTFQSDCEESPYFTEIDATTSSSAEAVSAVSDVEFTSDC